MPPINHFATPSQFSNAATIVGQPPNPKFLHISAYHKLQEAVQLAQLRTTQFAPHYVSSTILIPQPASDVRVMPQDPGHPAPIYAHNSKYITLNPCFLPSAGVYSAGNCGVFTGTCGPTAQRSAIAGGSKKTSTASAGTSGCDKPDDDVVIVLDDDDDDG